MFLGLFHFNLGTVFQKQNKIDEAIDMYEKVISVNSNYDEDYWNKLIS